LLPRSPLHRIEKVGAFIISAFKTPEKLKSYITFV